MELLPGLSLYEFIKIFMFTFIEPMTKLMTALLMSQFILSDFLIITLVGRRYLIDILTVVNLLKKIV